MKLTVRLAFITMLLYTTCIETMQKFGKSSTEFVKRSSKNIPGAIKKQNFRFKTGSKKQFRSPFIPMKESLVSGTWEHDTNYHPYQEYIEQDVTTPEAEFKEISQEKVLVEKKVKKTPVLSSQKREYTTAKSPFFRSKRGFGFAQKKFDTMKQKDVMHKTKAYHTQIDADPKFSMHKNDLHSHFSTNENQPYKLNIKDDWNIFIDRDFLPIVNGKVQLDGPYFDHFARALYYLKTISNEKWFYDAKETGSDKAALELIALDLLSHAKFKRLEKYSDEYMQANEDEFSAKLREHAIANMEHVENYLKKEIQNIKLRQSSIVDELQKAFLQRYIEVIFPFNNFSKEPYKFATEFAHDSRFEYKSKAQENKCYKVLKQLVESEYLVSRYSQKRDNILSYWQGPAHLLHMHNYFRRLGTFLKVEDDFYRDVFTIANRIIRDYKGVLKNKPHYNFKWASWSEK